MTVLVIAALFAFSAPSPAASPMETAAYYDTLRLPAEVGDRHAEMRAAIGAVLGERVVIAEHDVPGTPRYTYEMACKLLGARHLVDAGGGEFSAISSHPGGSKQLELGVWIWDCRDQRVAWHGSVHSAWYDNADGTTLRAMYRELSASLLERMRKGLVEPPDLAVP